MRPMGYVGPIDDVIDAHAQIRFLRKRVQETKAEWADAKTELATASARLETVLTEIEQQQGRLPLQDPEPLAE